ncbi:hypothetical protein C8R11_1161 [Nitrosomonas aestuarii]|nr:hypothetical protein C8R11_1161 [Nitrosomonas aestuarii]
MIFSSIPYRYKNCFPSVHKAFKEPKYTFLKNPESLSETKQQQLLTQVMTRMFYRANLTKLGNSEGTGGEDDSRTRSENV